MVDTGIFATTAEVQRKVGANASSTANTEAYINDYITQAESFINVLTRKNWSDIYSTLNPDVKGILKEAASNLAAIYVVGYDTLSYAMIEEQENLINLLFVKAMLAIEELKDHKQITFTTGA